MDKWKQTWLYVQLAKVFGEQVLHVRSDLQTPLPSYTYFPLQEGVETTGWVGIQTESLTEETRQLVTILNDHQHLFARQQQGSEEQYWRIFLQENVSTWRHQYEALNFDPQTTFRNLYFHIHQAHMFNNDELVMNLQEIVQGMVEQKSVFLPLNASLFIWIVPDEQQIDFQPSWIHGLLDTIRAECMIDVYVYKGEAYEMPCDLRAWVEREKQLFQLSLAYQPDRGVSQYTDLISILLLDACSTTELQHMVDKLLGPFQEDGDMLHTLQTFFEQNLNVSETAKALYLHRNSMQYRLDKFMEKTGMDIRQFEEGFKIYAAIQALGILHKK